MDSLELDKFNPTVAELQELVKTAGLLTLPDPTDTEQLKAVKTKRLELRDARVKVEKAGKGFRDDAVKFQKAVIAKEKELIAIIAPEEERLQGLEEEAKRIVLMNERRESLPARKEKLSTLGEIIVTDETILEMDEETFQTYYNTRVSDKNAKDAADIARREREVKDAEEKQKREAEMKEREANARKAAEEKAAREIEESKKREAAAEERARLAKETADREAKERQEREAKEKEEADRIERERLAKEEHIRITLEMHGYTEATKNDFIIKHVGGKVEVFKKIATFDE